MKVQHFEQGGAIELHEIWIFGFCIQLPHLDARILYMYMYLYVNPLPQHVYIRVHRYGARLLVSLSAPYMVTDEESHVYSTEETMLSVDPPTTPSG